MANQLNSFEELAALADTPSVQQVAQEDATVDQAAFNSFEDLANYDASSNKVLTGQEADAARKTETGSKFTPEEIEKAKGFGYTIATAAQRFANAAAFNIPRNAGAGLDALTEAVTTGDFTEIKKDFNKYRNQSIRREELGREATPTIGFLSEGFGYLRNPVSALKPVQALMKGGKLARLVGGALDATVVAAPTAVVNSISRIAAGEEAGDVIQNEIENAGLQAAAGGGIGVAAPYLFKPLATAGKYAGKVGDFLYSKLKGKLSPEGIKLIENIESLGRLKGNKKQLLDNTQKEIATAYENVENVFNTELQASAGEANALTDDMLKAGQKAFNEAGEDFIAAIQSKKPAAIAENLGKASEIVNKMDEAVSHNYSVEFDDIAKNIKTPVVMDDVFDTFRKDMQGSTDVIFTPEGLLKTEGKVYAQNKKGVDFINNLLGKAKTNQYGQKIGSGEFTFQEAGDVGKVIGKMVNWAAFDGGVPTVEDVALRNLYTNIADKLDNPELLGKAAERYKPLKQAYAKWLEVKGKIQNKAGALRDAATAEFDQKSFLTRMNAAVEGIEYAQNTAKGPAQIVTKMSPEAQQGLKVALDDGRKMVDIKTITKATKAQSTLKKIIEQGPDAVDTDIKTVKSLIDDYTAVDKGAQAIQKMDIANVVKEAALDPTNASKVKAAQQYIDKYVGAGKEELSAFLNRAAHGQRLMNIKDKGAAQILNQIRSGRTMAPEEFALLDLSAKVDPTISKMIQDADILEAWIKENPQLVTPEALARIGTGGAILGPAIMAIAAVPTMIKNLANPGNFILFLKRMEGKQKFSDEAILKAARVVNQIGKAINMKDDTQTDETAVNEEGQAKPKYDPVYREGARYR